MRGHSHDGIQLLLSRAMYAVARRLPVPVTARLQDLVSSNYRARAIVKRVSAPVRHGAQRIADGPAAGMLMDVAGSRPSYLLGRTESDLVDVMRTHLAPGGVLFDLGANVGYFTLIGGALVGPEGRVVAVEPLPANAHALRHNIALNGLSNTTVVEAAGSGAPGHGILDVHVDNQKSALSDGATPGTGLRVATVSIDSEAARLGISPTLLKIDVEGAELDVLQGAERVLREDRPVVLCEVHTARPDLATDPVAAFLRQAGYAAQWLGDVDGKEIWAPHLVAIPFDQGADPSSTTAR